MTNDGNIGPAGPTRECPECEGFGSIPNCNAVNALRFRCETCKGTGELPWEGPEDDDWLIGKY